MIQNKHFVDMLMIFDPKFVPGQTQLSNPLHAKCTYMCMGVVKKRTRNKKKRRSIAGIEPVTTGLVD